MMRSISLIFLNFDINKAMKLICVLGTVNMVIFNYLMVDNDLSVCGNSSAKTMVGNVSNDNTTDTTCYTFAPEWSKLAPN